MVVRIGCECGGDWDFNDYEEGERIRIGKDVISANFMILENEDQDVCRRNCGADGRFRFR